MRERTRRLIDRGALLAVVLGVAGVCIYNARESVRSAGPPRDAADAATPRNRTTSAPPGAATAPVDAASVDVAPADMAPADAAAIARQLRERFAQSSLRGTQPDGAMRFDTAGRVILDAGLRRVFDYWLALDGEFTPAEIRALLQADTSERHGNAAAASALAAFDRYVALLSQLAAQPPAGDPADRLRQLRPARRQWFGADADAMFGAEEAQIADTLQRQRIETDATLTDAERTTQLAALDAARPAAERQAQRDATSAHLAEEQTRQLDAAAADPATRHAERRDLWGAVAADRLAALDAERARWDARVSAFARERARLAADPRLDAAARERALATVLLRDFDEAERARVEALLRTGSLPPGG